MATQKPKMYYRVYQQSSRVGGKFYAVPDQSDPIVPQLTMQQIIDYKKLHNYSASQLAVLVEEVMQGAAELVSMDGQSRNLSSLMKFEPCIKGTFANVESGVTNQKIIVRPRMLKDIKVQIDRGSFEFVNEAESTDPRLRSVAIENDLFEEWSALLFANGVPLSSGALTFAGDRLCPAATFGPLTSWSGVIVKSGFEPIHMELATIDGSMVGVWQPVASSASDNSVVISRVEGEIANHFWRYVDDTHTTKEVVPDNDIGVRAGDKVVFTFTRERTDDETQTVSTTKEYILV